MQQQFFLKKIPVENVLDLFLEEEICREGHQQQELTPFYLKLKTVRDRFPRLCDLKKVQRSFEMHLSDLTAEETSIFWPLNEEEVYKQLRVLQDGLHSPEDLPQISIHLRQHSGSH